MIEKLAKQPAGTSAGSTVLADGTTIKGTPALIVAAAAIFGLLFFAARFSQTAGGIWDRDLLLWLNGFAPGHRYVWELANNSLLRGFPLFFSLGALWFAVDSRERRSRMLAGFLATCVATVLSIWMQFHLATHARPLLDPALPLMDMATPSWEHWDRRGSFPSDTAILYFSLASVIFLENRLVGLFCFLWVAVIIGVPRIIFGWHYATDIVASLVLGPACVLFFDTVLRTVFERALILFENRMYIVHAFVIIFLIQASDLFDSLQALGKALVRVSG